MKIFIALFYFGIGLLSFGWLCFNVADAFIVGGLLTSVGLLGISILYVKGEK